MYQRPTYLPAGDRALSIELGNAIAPEISASVRALYIAIEERAVPGVLEMVPTYRAILVYYDPLLVTYAELVDQLEALEATQATAPTSAPRYRMNHVVCNTTSYGRMVLCSVQCTCTGKLVELQSLSV